MEAVKCEAFLAAAELGSLTATAELLGYTQSGVTRMIGTLEEELGFPLFLRSKKGVQLTENGKLMLPLLREVPADTPYSGTVRHLIEALSSFEPLDKDALPASSMLREFVGASL